MIAERVAGERIGRELNGKPDAGRARIDRWTLVALLAVQLTACTNTVVDSTNRKSSP